MSHFVDWSIPTFLLVGLVCCLDVEIVRVGSDWRWRIHAICNKGKLHKCYKLINRSILHLLEFWVSLNWEFVKNLPVLCVAMKTPFIHEGSYIKFWTSGGIVQSPYPSWFLCVSWCEQSASWIKSQLKIITLCASFALNLGLCEFLPKRWEHDN